MDGTCETLTIVDVAAINREFIQQSEEEYIGPYNLQNPEPLRYILEEARGSLVFGVSLFPGTVRKAAAIAERIIIHHVFFGANKRTGMVACATFLELNGYQMQIFDADRLDQDVVDTAMALQEKEITFDQFVEWLEKRIVKIEKAADLE